MNPQYVFIPFSFKNIQYYNNHWKGFGINITKLACSVTCITDKNTGKVDYTMTMNIDHSKNIWKFPLYFQELRCFIIRLTVKRVELWFFVNVNCWDRNQPFQNMPGLNYNHFYKSQIELITDIFSILPS